MRKISLRTRIKETPEAAISELDPEDVGELVTKIPKKRQQLRKKRRSQSEGELEGGVEHLVRRRQKRTLKRK